MRSLRLAAAAILAGSMAVAVLAGAALAAPANLAAGFPATRIKLESPSTPVGMPGAVTLTATIVDWRGAPLANVPVVFTNVADRQKPSQLGKGTTDKGGHATLSYSNGKEPRIDVVQATFTDGLEVHKSNRSFIAWQSATPATTIASPAAIAVTPSCFQPSVALNPPIGPPRLVTSGVGRGFRPRTTIQFLNWGTPALRSPWPKNIKTDESGSFQYSILVLYHDLLGPRMLQAIVANPFGDRAGSAIEADAPFLVTPGRAQPNDLVLRR